MKPALKPVPQPFLVPEGLYALPTPLMVFHKPSNVVWSNPAYEKMFGAASVEVFTPTQPMHLIRERPVTMELLCMLGRHEGLILRTIKNEKAPVELRVSHYGDASLDTFLILVDDVSTKTELENKLIENHLELQKAYSQLKTTQDALVQSAKLASLGVLSSGIAHELNQPLQAIMGFGQELVHVEKLSPTGTEFANDIVNAARKMAEIIRSLRSFAREAGEELIATSLDHAAQEAMRLMRHSLMQRNIDIYFEGEESLPLVTANPIQLEQVIVNLVSNAADAIEARNEPSVRGKIKVSVFRKAKAVELQVTDNGCGMSEEVKRKIFDPFFTTKEVGKGTGLGLSISYGLLKKFNAEVDVVSKPGKGTTFIVKLPVSETPSKKGRSK